MKNEYVYTTVIIIIAVLFIFNFGIFFWSGAYKDAIRGSRRLRENEEKNKKKR